MIRILNLLTSIILFSSVLQAQVLDEETGFIFVKAEYLYETGRYDEAITQYNAVIAKDPKYKNALIKRGLAKYALAAYKGSKMDAMQFIEVNGISAESAGLLGRSFAAMNDANAAINCLTAAIALDANNTDYYEWRASILENEGQILQACKDYEAAMNLGSAAAESKAKNLCGISKTQASNKPKVKVPNQDSNEPPVVEAPVETTNSGEIQKDEVLSDGTKEPTEPVTENTGTPTTIDDSEHPVIDESLPKEDNTVNSFVIDEDLTIEISGQELGRRKIAETPSILILADENGKVTVNICVNKAGTVTKAEFNGAMSSIAKKSLVSLAIRKAKEFEFAPGQYDSQCGFMVFKIKGS
jgi:tetratricopeptide (TPR) repeat protein